MLCIALALFASCAAPDTLRILTGPVPGARFGRVLARLPDLDGDGVNDVAVGSPHDSAGLPLAGRVDVYSGATGRRLFHIQGDVAYARLGSALVGVEDRTGDGVPDLWIGAPMGTPAAGSVRAYSGADGRFLEAFAGTADGSAFASSLDSLGDLDDDGHHELAVGAPRDPAGGRLAGRVVVLSGSDGRVLYERTGAPFDQLGASVRRLPDHDGDGRHELACGAPFADHAAFNAGAVHILSGADGRELRRLDGETAGDLFGSLVERAGDVDADGEGDLLVLSPGGDGIGFDSGLATVYSPDGRRLLAISGTAAGEWMSSGTGIGDVDRDGHGDLLLGSTAATVDALPQAGLVRLVSGRTGQTLRRYPGRTPNAWFGTTCLRLGDTNEDGRTEVLIGAPGHDDHPDAIGYVEWREVGHGLTRPKGTPVPATGRKGR